MGQHKPHSHWPLSKLLIRCQCGLSRLFLHKLILVMKANPLGLISAPEFSSALANNPSLLPF